jgi:hypothetical protein
MMCSVMHSMSKNMCHYITGLVEHAPLWCPLFPSDEWMMITDSMDDDNCFQPNSFLFGFKYYYFNEFLEFLRIVRDV